MDEFYNKTVTVYNKAAADDVMGADIWYPVVLQEVRLLVSKGANMTTSGMESADTAKLYVDFPRPYLQPVAWQNEGNKVQWFTFQEGDFFVEGDTTAEDSTQDDFFSYMKSHYDNCFRVTTVDTYDLIPHLEVGGK